MNTPLKIVIAGAYGFIGKATVEYILSNTCYVVYALTRQKNQNVFQFNERLHEIVIDYNNHNELISLLKDKDVVINLVGKMGDYGVTKSELLSANVDFTKALISSCNETSIKQFIHVSTPGVQGMGLRLASEDSPYNPQDIYQETKAKAEQLVEKDCLSLGLKYTILRPDFVYGIGDTRRVKLYNSIKEHKFILTTNGNTHISPTYVTDVAQGICRSIRNEKAYNEIFNISGQELTVKQYLNTIAQSMNVRLIHINIGYHLSLLAALIISWLLKRLHKKPFVTPGQIKFLGLDHSTDYSKAKKSLGYNPQMSLDEGIILTINFCGSEN